MVRCWYSIFHFLFSIEVLPNIWRLEMFNQKIICIKEHHKIIYNTMR